METIYLNQVDYTYDSKTLTFHISEKEVKFATSYKLMSPKTGKSRIFEFTHSTGSEYDPKTQWIYACEDLRLHVHNDYKMTAKAAKNYLNAKLQKF